VGLILDSSVIIAAERKGQSVSELLTVTCEATGFVSIMLSAVSVTELEHGYWRAGTPERARRRRAWLDEVLEAIPVEPFTTEIAKLAAKVDAAAKVKGAVIPFADLQIGVTALHFGFALGTGNPRHFEMIPDLVVKRR
jgi:tRNA(fMet)-specific endonuclease VapC